MGEDKCIDRKNYFEILTTLSFDKVENDESVIENAINKWKRDIETKHRKETEREKKDLLEAEMSLEQEMRNVMLNKQLRKDEAIAMKKKKTEEVDNLAKVLRFNKQGKVLITNARIRNISNKIRLQTETVMKVFKENDFDIVQPKLSFKYDDLFLNKVNGDKLKSRIIKINEEDIVNSVKWLCKVDDLYDFIACYSGEAKVNYKNKKTEDLYAIVSKGVSDFAIDNSYIGHLLQDLFAIGKNYVFNNEKNREKYNNYLKLQTLTDFLDLLKNAPDELKKDEIIAENAIKKIREKFPDYEVARTIYNNMLGLVRDPYESEKALIQIYCGNCESPMTFTTIEEARNAKCNICGKPLFIECINCGKIIPSSTKQCECGFNILESMYFESYYNLALQSLKEMDLTEAKKMFTKAKIANPKHSDLKDLENKIQIIVKQFEKPLKELNDLLENKKIIEASNYLNNLKVKYPKLNLNKEEKTIKESLKIATDEFANKGSDPYTAANTCVNILRNVKDFEPAKEFVMKVKPHKVDSVTISYLPDKKGFYLNWNPVEDLGVKYIVVKKQNCIPMNINDGTIVKQEKMKLDCIDYEVEPGIEYNYGVFVERYSAISEGAYVKGRFLEELREDILTCYEDSESCRFDWVLPKNALGVRVLRCDGGNVALQPNQTTHCLEERAISNFNDNKVECEKMYEYRLQVIYNIKNTIHYSQGIVKQVIPEITPIAAEISHVNYINGNIILNISTSDRRVKAVKIISLKGDFVENNKIIPLNTINDYGVIVASGSTVDRQISFKATKNTGYRLAIVTVFGTKAITGNTVTISTFEKCDIDKNKTKVNNESLFIHMKEPLNENIVNFYYCVNIKKSSDKKAPYASKDDIEMGKMKKIDYKTYKNKLAIKVDKVAESDLYISVIAEIKNNKNEIFYSETSKFHINNNPKKVINYDINWGRLKIIKKNPELTIDCQFEEDVPKLYLVANNDGTIPKNYIGNNIIKICEVKNLKSKLEKIELPLEKLKILPNGCIIRLYVDEDENDEFLAMPKNIRNLIFPDKLYKELKR